MNSTPAIRRYSSFVYLLPIAGILLFMLLYIIAARYYPGGYAESPKAEGFSWLHNYWCNLMAEQAINGQVNTARPIAITAMAALCLTLIVFWYQVPCMFPQKRIHHFIRACGIASMLATPFLLIGSHNLVINIAAGLGFLAIMALLLRLYAAKHHSLFVQGIICLFLGGLNNYIYHTGHFWKYLPVIQKISFLFFLLWFMQVSWQVYRKKSQPANQ